MFEEKSLEIPLLLPSGRTREFDSYSSTQVAKIIYSWLFTELGHRELDKNILDLDPLKSKGYQSMSVLHCLGLKKMHKAILKDLSLEEGIRYLEEDPQQLQYIIKLLEKCN